MTEAATTETVAQRIERVAAELGLSMTAEFVPFSQSRNRGEKTPSLNWVVTIHAGKSAPRGVFNTEYTAGCAHCPSYKHNIFGRRTVETREREAMVAWECETGGKAQGVSWGSDGPRVYGSTRNKAKPETADVFASLAMDADVIDAGGFEEWAANLGYDTDSRKAEGIYKACLEIALKLRAAIGDEGLTKLREACQDY